MTEVMNFEHAGRTYAGFTPTDALAAGVPQHAIDAALAFARREKIKAECRSRIYGIASSEAQINISGAASLVIETPVADRSAEDEALLAAYRQSLAWIKAMREAVEALTLDADADITSDAAWPTCPAAVAALAAQF